MPKVECEDGASRRCCDRHHRRIDEPEADVAVVRIDRDGVSEQRGRKRHTHPNTANERFQEAARAVVRTAPAQEDVALRDDWVWDQEVTAPEPDHRGRELVRFIALERRGEQRPGVNDDGQFA